MKRHSLDGWREVADVQARVRVARAREALEREPNPSPAALEAMADEILGPEYRLSDREIPMAPDTLDFLLASGKARRVA